MAHKILRLDSFIECVDRLVAAQKVLDVPILKELQDYACALDKKVESAKATWNEFESFWPPRYIEGLINGDAIVFFGSGISLPCGIPTWGTLLTENLGLDKSLAEDDDVNSDPLTMAELAAEHLGSEKLQDVLRGIMNRPERYSVNHIALSALRCPVYITTNYDSLFERAWKDVNPTLPLVIVTNDADLSTSDYQRAITGNGTILFKIHGSSDRLDEHMILTRRDYRFHYRVNLPMFTEVRRILGKCHTLFLGFGHRDPEISRLVDDVIHEYEKNLNPKQPPIARPQFYSLQFDMKQYTSEVYAARGIVALKPPAIATEYTDVKTKALAVSLIDLVAAKQRNLHTQESLEGYLRDAMNSIAIPLLEAVEKLSGSIADAIVNLSGPQNTDSLQSLCDSLGEFASQGVYLLDDQGTVHDFAVPKGLTKNNRQFAKPLNHRPYFQQAKLFRSPFVSNSARSLINGQSTLFLCVPVIQSEQMIGLLFSALQIGQWKAPYAFAEKLWNKNLSILLVDGNGTCLIPPANEFQVQEPPIKVLGETPTANIGFPFDRLYVLSRRDILVKHIGKNVVPVGQDDDVLELSENLRQYTVVSQIPQTPIKLGISVSVHKDT
ncbi:SIR2 family protein [Methylomonas methanica]|uniref:Uncharacterized protein n=1 Tax=Methylomonas methanica (strain DSM 25384 / MC09) TaxID=857087 RepID=F9ZW46_METMM|nr:SIR2 family protein [Methylomonas methanica]AEG02017.1 hypothetical protein Metme_3656 [Methylomonas methanica MC09]